MSTLKQFLKNIGYIGTSNIAIALKSLIFIPIITKTLDAANFVIWAQLIVTVSLLIPFATLHLGVSLVRFSPVKTDRTEIGREFMAVLITSLAWSAVLAVLFFSSMKFMLSSVVDLSSYQDYILLVALIIPLMSLNLILFSYFRARLKMNLYAGIMILQSITELALVGGLVLLGFGIAGALLGLIINLIGLNILMFILIIKEIGLHSPDYSILSKYLAFALPLVPLELFWWIADSSDKYITGFFLGLSAVGVYAAVYGLSRIVHMFAVPLTFVLGPTLAKAYDNGKIDEVKQLLALSIKIYLTFAVPLVIGFTILAHPMLVILATEEFGEKGAILVPFICTAMLLYGIGAISGMIIQLVKKTKVAGLIWGGAAGINIALNFILIPRFGIIGAALSTLFTFGFATLIIVLYTKRFIIIPVDWWYISKSFTSAVIMGLVILVLALNIPQNLFSTIALIVLGIGIYFGMLFALKTFSTSDIRLIKSLLGGD
jgi:O-antigen/teichoic acid export membrane protein